MICPSGKCGSSNVESLPNYWASLPSDSPLKASLAQPPAVQAQYLVAVGVALFGVFAVAQGALAGLLLVLGGVVWGVVTHGRAEAADSARAEWGSSLICLACTGQFRP
jgi:hypothetical protein